jgi:uncharacterized protein YrrD
MESVREIDILIGRAVVSVETANKLGEVDDLIVDPVTGRLAGFSVQTPDQRQFLIDQQRVHSIGKDAVMVDQDSSLLPPTESPVRNLPLAKNQLLGAKVITKNGELLGEIRNLYIDEKDISLLVYEVCSSLFDKLLGHALYFPASAGCALSDDATRLVVGSTYQAERKLDALAIRVYATPGPQVSVRSI